MTIDNRNLTTCLYDMRDYLNLNIVNFPFLSSNIPSSPAYGMFVSHLVRYPRSSSDYSDFVKRGSVLAARLANKGFLSRDYIIHVKSSMVVIQTLLENMTNLCAPSLKIFLEWWGSNRSTLRAGSIFIISILTDK